MFRTQTNEFDEVIAKATDENLTSENWEYMMDAWEKVNSGGENASKDAVAALIKRLAHRNANVQLYTLELANAFTQNCGPSMHREMASRAFTDSLLRLASDRNTHAKVKSSIIEKMAEWSAMFESDPGLGIMEQSFSRLKSANPNIHPPSKPTKREITDLDRQKEEEELQMALAISLKEKSNTSQGYKPAQASSSHVQTSIQPAATQPAVVPHTTAATVSRVRALYDFIPSESGELAFRKGDIIAVLESVYKDWWKGSLRGQTGIFPLNYVEKLSDPTVEELQKDAQIEAEVFGQIKNVEKLLALLSTSEGNSSVQDNEEITKLYHSTLQIRPKLIELIGKYSQKKDDFVALNEKFIKARRDYEALLESSMSPTAAAHYGRPPASANPYGYPPADGYPEPGRYYTPAPQNASVSPQNPQGAYPPPQQKPGYGGGSRQSSNQYYPQQPTDDYHPPQGGVAPFYIVGQMPPGQPPTHGRNSVSPSETPQHQQRPSAPAGAPTSTSHQTDGPTQPPQELATSIYDTPIESTHESSFAPNATGKPASPPHGLPPPHAGSYQPYQYQQRQLSNQQTSYAGPEGPSPVSPQNPYPPLQGSPPPPQSYQVYPQQRPQIYYTPQTQPSEPGLTSAGAPQDYYRQNELFLPNGARSQG